MAHYAFLDENNVVVQVITGLDEGTDGLNWEEEYELQSGLVCKRTSYNTRNGSHYDNSGELSDDQSKAFRKNYAGIGYTYDETRDAFIPPKPYPSWILNEDTCNWEPPVAEPTLTDEEVDNFYYEWNEDTTSWDKIEVPDEEKLSGT